MEQFEVELNGGGMDRWIVSVVKRTCTCRRWQLSGYPCWHAICCLNFLGLIVEDYVDDCYKRSTYVQVYKNVMLPLGGQNIWSKSDLSKLLPPVPEKIPGRPKMNTRRKSSIEIQEMKAKLVLQKDEETGKLGRHGMIMRYSYCKLAGHNKTSCVKRAKEVPQEGGNTSKANGKAKAKGKAKARKSSQQEMMNERTTTDEPTRKSLRLAPTPTRKSLRLAHVFTSTQESSVTKDSATNMLLICYSILLNLV